MILNGKNPNLPKAIETNRKVKPQYPCCGHDFWKQAKTLEFGDIIMCNQCHVYYAKIKHLPWLVEKKEWLGKKVEGHHTNHLAGEWYMPLTARVTD